MAILTYHHIGPCPPGQEDHRGLWVDEGLFTAQLRALKSWGYTCMTLHDVAASFSGRWRLPRRWVCITFDDGWRDNYERALPQLVRYGMFATFFMVTSRIRPNHPTGNWDDYLSLPELHEMVDAGMEIGSHTHTHPHLTRLDDSALKSEIVGSREILADVLGQPPEWFCYPYGNFSQRVAKVVREAGYGGATSTIRDNRVRASQRYWMPRVMIMQDTQPRRLRYMLSGTYHLVHAWKNRSRWEGAK